MQKRLIGSLLAISLLPMTTGIVASATPQLAMAFPTASATTLNLVVTLPSFAMMVLVLASQVLVQRWGSKRLVIIGLGLVAIAAGLAMVAPTIKWLLAARLLLGVGLGLYNALAVSLISRLFQGAQRQRLLGYQNAVQGLGALVGALAVAGLLLISWRAAFGFYLISLPIMLAYLKNVPEVSFKTPVQAAPTLTSSQWVKIGAQAGLLFVLMTFYMLATLKLPSLMVTRKLGTSSAGAMLLVVMSLGTVLAGLSYQWVKQHCQMATSLVGTLAMLGGYLALLGPASRWWLVSSALLIGLSFGWFVPNIFGTVTQIVLPVQANLVTTILMTSSNLANFSASFVLVWLAPTRSQTQFIWHSLFILGSLSSFLVIRQFMFRRITSMN